MKKWIDFISMLNIALSFPFKTYGLEGGLAVIVETAMEKTDTPGVPYLEQDGKLSLTNIFRGYLRTMRCTEMPDWLCGWNSFFYTFKSCFAFPRKACK